MTSLVADSRSDAGGRLQHRVQSYRDLLRKQWGIVKSPKSRTPSPSGSPRPPKRPRRPSSIADREPVVSPEPFDAGTAGDDLRFLETHIHPWDDVVKKWRNTFSLRNSLQKGDEALPIHEYIAKFPALSTNKGLDLVSIQFSTQFQMNSIIMFEIIFQLLETRAAIMFPFHSPQEPGPIHMQ